MSKDNLYKNLTFQKVYITKFSSILLLNLVSYIEKEKNISPETINVKENINRVVGIIYKL